jgi:peptidyl-prolyl cis-trans isomerase C
MMQVKTAFAVLGVVALVGVGCRQSGDNDADVAADAVACKSCPCEAKPACATCPEKDTCKKKGKGTCAEKGACKSGAGASKTACSDGACPLPGAEVPSAPAAPAGTNMIVDVSGEVLTQAGLDMAMQQMMQQMMQQQGIPPQMMGQFMQQGIPPQMRKQAIDQFIDRALILKAAKAGEFTVTDAEVDAALDTFRSQLPEGMTLEQAVAAQGDTMEKLRKDALNGELTRKLYEAQTAKVAAPTDDEVASFYNEHPQYFVTKEEAHARHILVGCKASDGAEARVAAKAKAEALRKSVLEGADFASVARENSSCGSAQRGGDLGSFGRGAMVPPFEAAAFSQATNAIGEVVETEHGFHIVQVLERTDAGTNSLAKVSDDILGFLSRRSKGEVFQAFSEGLREGAEIVYAEAPVE